MLKGACADHMPLSNIGIENPEEGDPWGFRLGSFVTATSAEPFANIEGDYTCYDRNKKRADHMITPPSVTGIGCGNNFIITFIIINVKFNTI